MRLKVVHRWWMSTTNKFLKAITCLPLFNNYLSIIRTWDQISRSHKLTGPLDQTIHSNRESMTTTINSNHSMLLLLHKAWNSKRRARSRNPISTRYSKTKRGYQSIHRRASTSLSIVRSRRRIWDPRNLMDKDIGKIQIVWLTILMIRMEANWTIWHQ